MKCICGCIALGCALAFLLAGCEEITEVTTDTKTVEAAGAETADVNLRMGAGELRLSGGAQALMEAEFIHRANRRPPEVDYRVSGTKGILTVRQRRRGGIHIGSSRNEWNVRLNDAIPMDIRISLGAGENRLDLGSVDVRSLSVDMGVGEMRLDLRGRRQHNLDVNIDGGIGSGTMYLPADVGVRARVSGGIGSVSAPGFSKNGRIYTNDEYGKSPVTIDIKIEAGIGSIDLRLD